MTGAAHRVGRAITVGLARQGYDVIVHCFHSPAQARRTAKFIEGFGVRAAVLRADLSKVHEAKRLAHSAWKRFGAVDVLVNSAAIFLRTPLGSVGESDWDRLLDTNLKGPFFLTQQLALKMRRRGRGHIINILDTGAFRPWSGYLPYCISKAGGIMLTQGLAKALAPQVRVNAVAPGPVLPPPGMPARQRQDAAASTLLKRMGRPEDIAQTVGFLADGPDYITGAIFNVDGGRLVL